jgi:DNA-binding MarR family transcriptional regulator
MDQRVVEPTSGILSLDLSEKALRRAIELFFFAYRDFTEEADALLAHYGFGRAHHRVIYFVGRHPGMSVSELLAILKITKQSLSPVLGQLMRGGFVVQRPDPADRRRRRLHLTTQAQALEQQLTARQARRIAAAFEDAGAEAASGFTEVLRAIINKEDRQRLETTLEKTLNTAKDTGTPASSPGRRANTRDD